jgi:lipoate-protein ligase A
MTRHGEFKTPGGKLIAVDFDVADGTLRDVMVSGDFFLYPDDAFPAIVAALEGSPATLDASAYAARVRLVLARGADLVGSSPEALGTAVVRALRGDESSGATDGR